jgi:hypothetical protein
VPSDPAAKGQASCVFIILQIIAVIIPKYGGWSPGKDESDNPDMPIVKDD